MTDVQVLDDLMDSLRRATTWRERIPLIERVLDELKRHHGAPTRSDIRNAKLSVWLMEHKAQDPDLTDDDDFIPFPPKLKTLLTAIVAMKRHVWES